jgi:hypothetical protein
MQEAFQTCRWWWGTLPADPSFLGWLATVAYVASTILCVLAAFRDHEAVPQRRIASSLLFWCATALLLLLLGLNKQMDVQTLFTALLREVSQAQGWYEWRRPLQKVFVLLLGATCTGFYAVLLFQMRRSWRRYRLALAGFVLLGLYVLFRASTFYHFHDAASGEETMPWLKWALELGGIACMASSAFLRSRRAP